MDALPRAPQHEPAGGSADPPALETWRALDASLRRSLRRRARDEHELDDLVQEAFLRVQAGLSGLRDAERLEAWAGRIARNALIDTRRARQDPAAGAAELDPEAAPASRDEEPGLSAELAQWLAREVEGLAPVHRTILRRVELEGASVRAAAEELGLSLPAAKARLRRGRAELRRRIEACCRLELDRRGGVLGVERRVPGACDCDCDGA